VNRSGVSNKFNVSVSTLRHLERQGVLPKITESGSTAYVAALRLYLAARKHLPAAVISAAWREVAARAK